MANISGYSAIANGTADSNRPYASVMSNNFSQIAVAINSNALNSANYSTSALLSSHIQTSQIQSYHIAQNQVLGAHLSGGVIVESNMNYKSASDGVRVIRYGGVSSNCPAYGVQIARYVIPATYATDGDVMAASDDPLRHQLSMAFTDGYADVPSFTAAPYFLGEPVIVFGTAAQADSAIFGTNYAGPSKVFVKGLDSESCLIEFAYAVSNDNTYQCNVYFAVMGAKSSG